jgi:hypothetical protein
LAGQSFAPFAPWREEIGYFMRHSFKVMHDEIHTVKVQISPGWARWAGEKIWHESQKEWGRKFGVELSGSWT